MAQQPPIRGRPDLVSARKYWSVGDAARGSGDCSGTRGSGIGIKSYFAGSEVQAIRQDVNVVSTNTFLLMMFGELVGSYVTLSMASSATVEDVGENSEQVPSGLAPAPTRTAEQEVEALSAGVSTLRSTMGPSCQEGANRSTNPTWAAPQSLRTSQSPRVDSGGDDHALWAEADPDVPMMSLQVRRPKQKNKMTRPSSSVVAEPKEIPRAELE